MISSWVMIGSGEPIEERNLVEFHLLYNGKLHSKGDVREKHDIRKSMHPQLRRLWLTNRNLRMKAERFGPERVCE